jgi:hypothetical protein
VSREDVFNQADALMRRHRSFVARAPEDQAAHAAENPPSPEADIPLLTEVVEPTDLAPASIDDILAALQEDIQNELSAWLVEMLPAAVASASQHILTELDIRARNTLLPRLLAALDAKRDGG